jgi:hypothetical protein
MELSLKEGKSTYCGTGTLCMAFERSLISLK